MEVGPYTYLISGLLLGLPVWIPLYLLRKDLRHEMLVMSVFVGLCAPLWAPFFFDYWTPVYLFPLSIGSVVLGNLEDVIYGFFIGGIASVFYEVVFQKRILKVRNRRHHWKWLIVPALVLLSALFHGLMFIGWNSIYAALLIFVVFALFICFYRHDLVFNAVSTGVLLTILTFLGYMVWLALFPTVIQEWWHLEQVSGVLLAGVPIEELIWSFTLGLVVGPLYEFYMGIRLGKR